MHVRVTTYLSIYLFARKTSMLGRDVRETLLPRFFLLSSPCCANSSAAHCETSYGTAITMGLFLRASSLPSLSLSLSRYWKSKLCGPSTHELITVSNRSGIKISLPGVGTNPQRERERGGWRRHEERRGREGSLVGGVTVGGDCPQELITRPIWAKSRRVITPRGLLLPAYKVRTRGVYARELRRVAV